MTKERTLRKVKAGGQAKANRSNLNVVMVYDDRHAASRAMNILSGLVRQFGDDFEFRCDLWRFDVLGLPEVRREAACAGAAADLLVVSASCDKDLPLPVQDWLNSCADGMPPGSAALVGLLESRGRGDVQCRTRQFLKDAADRNHLGFFLREVDLTPMDLDPTCASREQRINPGSSALRGLSRGKPTPCPPRMAADRSSHPDL